MQMLFDIKSYKKRTIVLVAIVCARFGLPSQQLRFANLGQFLGLPFTIRIEMLLFSF